jgi:xylulose-5-phosphate/fructose-6-phosphate phosphoketolase
MTTKTLSPELRNKMNAYWRAANYLSVGQIYLYDNSRLKRPLTPADHFTEGDVAVLIRSRRKCW